MACKKHIINALKKTYYMAASVKTRESSLMHEKPVQEAIEFSKKAAERAAFYQNLAVKREDVLPALMFLGEVEKVGDEKLRKIADDMYTHRLILEQKNFFETIRKIPLPYRPEAGDPPTLLEKMDDLFRTITLEARRESFFKRNTSQSVRWIYENNKDLLNTIYDAGGQQNLQAFFRKIKRLENESPEKVREIIANMLRQMQNLAERIKESGGQIVYSDEKYTAVGYVQHQQAKKLGSPAWCIFTYESYFEQYVGHDGVQYSIFDENSNLLAGITIRRKKNAKGGGYVYAAADYNDNYLSEEKLRKMFPPELMNSLVPKTDDEIREMLIQKDRYDVVNALDAGLYEDVASGIIEWLRQQAEKK